MKKYNLLFLSLFAALLLANNSTTNAQKTIVDSSLEKAVQVQTKDNNKTTVVKKNNVFEITQAFSNKNKQSEIISKPLELDLSSTSGAMISAYSTYNSLYSISYKTFESNSWSDWIALSENSEVKNPNRKVFSPKNLSNSVKKIKFKASEITESEVIFRIYTFQK